MCAVYIIIVGLVSVLSAKGMPVQIVRSNVTSASQRNSPCLLDLALQEIRERAMRLETANRHGQVERRPSFFEWGMEGPFDLAFGAYVRSVLAHAAATDIISNVGFLPNIHGVVGASAGGMFAVRLAAGSVPTVAEEKWKLDRIESDVWRLYYNRAAHPGTGFYDNWAARCGVSKFKMLDDLPKPVVLPTLCFRSLRNASSLPIRNFYDLGNLVLLNTGPTVRAIQATTNILVDSSHVGRPAAGPAPLAIDGHYPCVDGGLGDSLGVEGLAVLTMHPSRNGGRRLMLLQVGSYSKQKQELFLKQYPGNVTEAAVLRLAVPALSQINCNTLIPQLKGSLMKLTRCFQAPAKTIDVAYSVLASRMFKPMERIGKHNYRVDAAFDIGFARWLSVADRAYSAYQTISTERRFRFYHRRFGHGTQEDWEA